MDGPIRIRQILTSWKSSRLVRFDACPFCQDQSYSKTHSMTSISPSQNTSKNSSRPPAPSGRSRSPPSNSPIRKRQRQPSSRSPSPSVSPRLSSSPLLIEPTLGTTSALPPAPSLPPLAFSPSSYSSSSSPLSTFPLSTSISFTISPCRSVENYERLNFIDEGTYGRVFRAREKSTGKIYALKQVKLKDEKDGFPITALREIGILLGKARHPNVVAVKEVVIGSSMDKVYVVMEYLEHDLKEVLRKMVRPYTQSEVKCLLKQIISGVAYLHENWILHRDLKTSNILLNHEGILKICDFGLARLYGDPLKPYTQLVVTLWYRAPELLMGAKTYTPAIDVWSIGCIFAELLTLEPLFPGNGELDQLNKITSLLGSPSEAVWKGYDKLPNAKTLSFPKGTHNKLRSKFPVAAYTGNAPAITSMSFDLLKSMLTYDPEKRITLKEALNHEYFSEPPPPIDPSLIQTFPTHRS